MTNDPRSDDNLPFASHFRRSPDKWRDVVGDLEPRGDMTTMHELAVALQRSLEPPASPALAPALRRVAEQWTPTLESQVTADPGWVALRRRLAELKARLLSGAAVANLVDVVADLERAVRDVLCESDSPLPDLFAAASARQADRRAGVPADERQAALARFLAWLETK